MKFVTDLTDACAPGPSVVTLGKFDGLHRGHQQLFALLRAMKEEQGLSTVAFTFDMSLLFWKYGQNFQLIMDNDERMHMFEKMGLDLVIQCPFTDEIRSMEAESFIKEVLVDKLKARCIVIGKDFCFGHERKGNYALLEALSEKYGYTVSLIGEVYDGEETERISSTRIRSALADGRMEDANRMLGYAFTVEGMITKGEQLGRTIDMPTINLTPSENKLLPPFGVYSSITEIEGRFYPGVTNIGRKPTVGNFAKGVETHLLDIHENLYGKFAKVRLYHFQRPEQKFTSIDELKAQMHRDRENARKILSEYA